jgi:hypothetical protein
MTSKISRPSENEYVPYYAQYIQRVPDGDVFELMAQQPGTLHNLLSKLSPEQGDFRHGPVEWSIKEVIGHLNDAERIFAYRALRFSRNDMVPLPGFDQEIYIPASNYGERTLPDILEEFDLLRRANILAFNRLSDEVSQRCGTANNAPVSVRALIYIIAGHTEHHIESLKVDYLPKI